MSFDADLVVLGGGCAGLSLGVRLAHAGAASVRTVIVEGRTEYANDRTWCFWEPRAHRFAPMISHSWSKMRVRTAAGAVVFECGDTPYQLLDADTFYGHAVGRIGASSEVELALGVRADGQPERIAGGWAIDTSSGLLRTRRIIDTRPPRRVRSADALLWQSFVGEEVECGSPVFDATIAELMDFADARDDGMAFTYVLPMSSTRALVEYTVFGRNPLSAQQLVAEQRRAVARVTHGVASVTLRREHGVLPMGLTSPAPSQDQSNVRVGLMCGAGRPSTGYAFQRIQRWASMASTALRSRVGSVGHVPDALHQRAMDRLFLHVLRAHPERGPELFLSMFRRVDPARIIRFLSDQATFLDHAAVIASLPVGLFVSQLPQLRSPRPLTLGWNS